MPSPNPRVPLCYFFHQKFTVSSSCQKNDESSAVCERVIRICHFLRIAQQVSRNRNFGVDCFFAQWQFNQLTLSQKIHVLDNTKLKKLFNVKVSSDNVIIWL